MKTPLIVALVLLVALVTYGWLHSTPHESEGVSAAYDKNRDTLRRDIPFVEGADLDVIPKIPVGPGGDDGKSKEFEEVGKAASSRGPQFDEFMKQGREHEERKEWTAAIDSYDKAYVEKPRNIRVLEKLPYCLISRRSEGDLTRAREVSQRLTEVDPATWIGWYNVACCEALMGNPTSALGALSRAMAANPTEVRKAVKDDPDFDPIRGLPEFGRIVNPKESSGSR